MIQLKGRITQNQIITGAVKVTSDISGAVGDVVHISGTISRQTQRLTGIVKNPSHVHGIISKPSGRGGQCDHVFVIVDLLKLYAAQTNVVNANATADMSATNTQNVSGQLDINMTSSTVTVVQATVTE